MVSPAGDPNPQARLGAGRYSYSTSSGTKSGSSSVKIKNRVSTNVLSKSNHTHGGGITEYHAHGKSRIRLGFDGLDGLASTYASGRRWPRTGVPEARRRSRRGGGVPMGLGGAKSYL